MAPSSFCAPSSYFFPQQVDIVQMVNAQPNGACQMANANENKSESVTRMKL